MVLWTSNYHICRRQKEGCDPRINILLKKFLRFPPAGPHHGRVPTVSAAAVLSYCS